MTQSDPKSEIKPTMDHLSDPYVLQLIEALAKRDDEIERLRAALERIADRCWSYEEGQWIANNALAREAYVQPLEKE